MTRAWLGILPLSVLAVAGSARAQNHPLPRTGELIDSAAYVAMVRGVSAGAAGKLTLSLTIDSAGRLLSARPLPSKLSEAMAVALADSLVAYARPQAPWKDGRWWVRLAVELGTEPRLRVERSQIDIPEMVVPPLLDENVGATLSAASRGITGRAEITYRLLVAEDGSVLEIRPGTTTSPELVSQLQRNRPRMRYRPGRVDGVPQPMWLDGGIRTELRSVQVRP